MRSNALFSWSTSIFLWVLIAGMILAMFNGNQTGFDLRPALPWVMRILGQTGYAVDLANGKVEDREKNKPFTQIAKERVIDAQKAIQETTKNSPALQPLPETGKPDGRLAVCPNGSVEPLNVKELPITLTNAFKLKVEQKSIKTYLDVQRELGSPACSWKTGGTNQWKFLGKGNRIIDVIWTEEKITDVKLSGF